MATINIPNLRPAGSELFSDSENYMSELIDGELNYIKGGVNPSPFSSLACAVVVGGGYIIANWADVKGGIRDGANAGALY